MPPTDVESGPVTRNSNKCIYYYLVCWTVVTLLTLLGGAAVFAHLHKEIEEINSQRTDEPLALHSRASPQYKFGQLAYLRVTSGKVKNQTMMWEKISYGSSSSIGGNFYFDEYQHKLVVKSAGSYFVYINLYFTSSAETCRAGKVTVALQKTKTEELLSCEVELPDCHTKTHASKRCWNVVPHLSNGSSVLALMHVTGAHIEEQNGWTMSLNESGFGMFLVDGS